MKEKILSIIIPSYNMESYISTCLDSLLIPEIEMLDILVINDGSKDKTSEIAHSYEAKFPDSIRVIDKENGNYGSCINRGLKEAKGKYVKVLDADDTFESVNFSKFINFIKDIEVDCIITDYKWTNPKNELIKRIEYKKIPKNMLLALEEIDDILIQRLSMHAVTYKISLLRDINYYQSEGISYTDIEWIYSPIAAAKFFIYLPIELYIYLIGREGQTVDPNVIAKHVTDTISGIKKQTEIFQKYNDTEINMKYLRRKLAKRLIRLYTNNLIRSSVENNRSLLKNLDKHYNDKWEKVGIDLVELTKLPLLKRSFIKEWRECDYDLNYSFSKLYRIKIYGDLILSKIIQWHKPAYLTIQ